MIKHIVMFQLKEEADGKTKAELLQEAQNKLAVFEAEIPTLKKLKVVTDCLGPEEHNYDIALICDFDSIEGMNEYKVHPTHVAFGKFITAVRENRACIDYEYEA